MTVRSFKKNEYLVLPGDLQKEIYFIRSGVQMSFFEHETKLHVMAFTYAPELSAIPDSFPVQKPSKFALRCVTDSTMECLSFDDLQNLFDRSQQIERLFRKMTEHVLAGLVKRHLDLKTTSMEQRFREFCKRSTHLLQLVPHKYIASYLDIDPTNFSKLYNSIRI
jgi:CRP-like cAMP-binding protein